MMKTDRFAAYGLGEADEPFRRAVRDGFRRAGLSHAQLTQALEWYRDHVRPNMDESALSASFSEFTRNKGWSIEQQVAASSVRDAIRHHGPEAVMAPTPTAAEDQEIIAKANALLAKDAAAYFADQELQESMYEALERQAAPELSSAPPPAPSGDEIERRIGRQDMQKFETMMREEPGKYWSSPQLQAAYRDAIEGANAAPAAEAPAEVPTAAPAATEAAPAPAAELSPKAAWIADDPKTARS
jgi:hypothetical protein